MYTSGSLDTCTHVPGAHVVQGYYVREQYLTSIKFGVLSVPYLTLNFPLSNNLILQGVVTLPDQIIGTEVILNNNLIVPTRTFLSSASV